MSAPGKLRALAPASSALNEAGGAAFELKGTVSSLTVLRLCTIDSERIAAELAAHVEPFPQIFRHAPVVVDTSLVDGQAVPWIEIAGILRKLDLVPVGAANVRGAEVEKAVACGFGILKLGSRMRTLDTEPAAQSSPPVTSEIAEEADGDDFSIDEEAPISSLPVETPTTLPPATREAFMVTQPVRGGQVVYARGGDMVARAPVNSGAQVIADGSIHVWAPLRGRALAGAQGRKDARIFCLSLEAELLSVAGEYVMAEEIPDELRGRPVQVFLDGERVRIAPL
jgi:septum site-determining protein MinC